MPTPFPAGLELTHLAWPRLPAAGTPADVWSFGILLWQLVAGEDVPYRHLAVHEVAAGVSLGLVSAAAASGGVRMRGCQCAGAI